MWWPPITLPPFTGCHVHDLGTLVLGVGVAQPLLEHAGNPLKTCSQT